jgi:hypothetical protein
MKVSFFGRIWRSSGPAEYLKTFLALEEFRVGSWAGLGEWSSFEGLGASMFRDWLCEFNDISRRNEINNSKFEC